jgi:hypothetical protein
MKIGRRGFLGFMGGAVAAGPKLAQDLASNAVPSMGQFSSGAVGYAAPVSEGDWRLRRIADLRKFLKMGDPHEKRERRARRMWALETQSRYRLDALQSVSAQHKYRMLLDGEEKRAEMLRRLEWENELERLLGMD